MIRLSDEQLRIVQEMAVPLRPWQRDRYLQAVAQRLAGVELGDGAVHAAAVAAQREILNGAKPRLPTL